MPRSAAQNEQMRAATRAALVDSAMTLFAEHGYAHTSTRSIARAAGISTGLIYHYFDSKESLLTAVFDHCMVLINQTFIRAYEASAPEERLANLLRTMFTMLAEEEPFWSLFFMLRTQPAIMRVLGDDFRIWTRRLRDVFVEELRQKGRHDPEMEALLLYSLIEGTIQQFSLDPANYPLERVATEIIARLGT